jgi:hypothetical protein
LIVIAQAKSAVRRSQATMTSRLPAMDEELETAAGACDRGISRRWLEHNRTAPAVLL